MAIIVGVIAAVILLCVLVGNFIHKHRDLIAETLDEVDQEMITRKIDIGTAIDRLNGLATLTRKYVREEYKGGTLYFVPTFLFTYADQSEVVLSVSMDIFEQINEGETDLLTVRYGEFESFGADSESLEEEMAPFLMDNFDDMFDRPLTDVYEPEELFEPGDGLEETEEEAFLRRLYERGKPLPTDRLPAADLTDRLFDYSALNLIRISGMPAFLRREQVIQELYLECFKMAGQAFVINYEQEQQGKYIEKITHNGNCFILRVILKDAPEGDDYLIESDLLINPEM